MDDFLIDSGLRIEGFNEQQIAQIKAALDDAMHIAATIKAIMPRIDRVVPVAEMVLEKLNTKVNS